MLQFVRLAAHVVPTTGLVTILITQVELTGPTPRESRQERLRSDGCSGENPEFVPVEIPAA